MRATKVPHGVVLLYASAFLMAYEQVISFDNLYKGLKESCRNIRWKDSTVGYEGNALKNTYRLRQCKKEIEARLFALGLQLNDKTALYPLRQGVKLLQWRFIVTDTGAIIRKMGKKKQSKQRRKLKKLYAKERRGEYAPGTAHESLVSWLANAARGDTYHERLKMINYFKNMEATYNAREYL